MSDAVDITIIIINYRTREYLRQCLRSTAGEQGIRTETIVVDNDSRDGSVEMAKSEFPGVSVIANAANLGFARANNQALSMARGDFVLLLNPDVEVRPGAMRKMLEFMRGSGDIGAAGCRVYYPDGRVQMSCGRAPTIASALFGGQSINRVFRRLVPGRDFIGSCGVLADELGKCRDVETLLGACVILRRSVLEQVGPFDEHMFMYFEECELFDRIRKSNNRVVYFPDASVSHHAGASVERDNIAAAVGHYLRSQEYYLGKVHGLRHARSLRIAIAGSALVKAACLALTYPVTPHSQRRGHKKKMMWHWHMFCCSAGRVLTAPAAVSGNGGTICQGNP
jgi:GT2 family glycosyltransferase